MPKKPKSSGVIKVEVSKLGEETKTVTLEEDSNVSEALEAAGYSSDSSAKINGEAVDGDVILEDGDEIFVGSSVKGGIVS